jgi:hypothetical protein
VALTLTVTQVFKECIRGIMKGKTVVITTHHGMYAAVGLGRLGDKDGLHITSHHTRRSWPPPRV